MFEPKPQSVFSVICNFKSNDLPHLTQYDNKALLTKKRVATHAFLRFNIYSMCLIDEFYEIKLTQSSLI